jgi:hypothetical protein
LCAGVPNTYADAKKSDSIKADANKNTEANKDSQQPESEIGVPMVSSSTGITAITISSDSANSASDGTANGRTGYGVVEQEKVKDAGKGKVEKDGESEKREEEEEKEEEVDTVLWWKLRENFIARKEGGGGSAIMTIEIKTWNDLSSDYGTFKLHSVDLHLNARQYFKNSKFTPVALAFPEK